MYKTAIVTLSIIILLLVAVMARAEYPIEPSPCPVCLTVEPSIYKTCVDGYEYVVVKQGCSIIGFTQAFGIYTEKNGKPKMSLPIRCNDNTSTPIP